MQNTLFTPELIVVLCLALALVITGGLSWRQKRSPQVSGPKPNRKESTPDNERLKSNILYGARIIAAGMERDVDLLRTGNGYAKWPEESFWR
ncbi:MAG: hypothetical protein C4575_10400 [Desulforudis sp.]|nr:MAG: hypothetical protein C4575_10400 [Desulforudis sp.]